MKRFLSIFLSGLMIFALSLSLAGCGNDDVSAKPDPGDTGQVAGESQDPEESSVTLNGTYITKEEPPLGLGTELTFTGGKVSDNTGESGTYSIDSSGTHLTIEHQGIEARYMFSQDDQSIYLDYVEYVSTEASEAKADAPPPNPDDPWDGLIVEWTLGRNYNIDEFPTFIVVDPDKYEEYLKRAIQWYASQDKISSTITINIDQVTKEAQATDVRFVNDDGTQITQLVMHGSPLNQILPGIGTVVSFSGNWDVEFTYSDGTTSLSGDVGIGSETEVFYSLDLSRILTPREVESAFNEKWNILND